jgi:hypothetical protein
MSNKLNVLINKIVSLELTGWYKKHYLTYDKYYLSDEYNLDIEYIIYQFKIDILNEFKIVMEQEINIEDDEDIQEQLITLNNNYDNTFEYISKCYDDNIYYPNHFNINLIIDLFELKNDNTATLK